MPTVIPISRLGYLAFGLGAMALLATPATTLADNKSSIISSLLPNFWNSPLIWQSAGEPGVGDHVYIGPAMLELDQPEANFPIFYVSSRPEDTILGTLTINAPGLSAGLEDILPGQNTLLDFGIFFSRGVHQAAGVLRTTNEIIGDNQQGYYLQTGGLHTVEEDSILGKEAGGMGVYLIDAPIDGLYRVRRDFIVGDAGTGFFQQFQGGLIVEDDLMFGRNGGEGIGFIVGPVEVGGDVVIGRSGAGEVAFFGEFQVGGTVHLGQLAGGYGKLTSGSAAQLQVDGSVNVGDAGNGEWLIMTGASPTMVTGDVRVGNQSGADGLLMMFPSTVLNVGNHLSLGIEGAGGFFALGNNTIQVDGWLSLGSLSTGESELSLQANSSLTVGGPARLGGYGSASVTAASGSTITLAQDLEIGAGQGSVSEMFLLTGSELTVVGDTVIGQAGTAQLVLGGGALGNTGTAAFEGFLDIGTQANGHIGSGRLELHQGSVEVDGFTRVGFTGNGTWQQTGGQAIFNSALSLGHEFTGSGTLDLSGGAMSGNILLLMPWGAAAQISGGSLRFQNAQQLGGSFTFAEGHTLKVGQAPAGEHLVDQFILDGGTLTVPELVINGGTFEQRGGNLITDRIEFSLGVIKGDFQSTGEFEFNPAADFQGRLHTSGVFGIEDHFSPAGGMTVTGYTDIYSGGSYSGGNITVGDGGYFRIREGGYLLPSVSMVEVVGGDLRVNGSFQPGLLRITGGLTWIDYSSDFSLATTDIELGSTSPTGSDLVIREGQPLTLPGGVTMQWSGSMTGGDGAGSSRLHGAWTIAEGADLRLTGTGQKELIESIVNHGLINWGDGDLLTRMGSNFVTNHGTMIVEASGNNWEPQLANHGTIGVANFGGAHFGTLANHGLIEFYLAGELGNYSYGGFYVLGPYSGDGDIRGYQDSRVYFEGGGVIGGTIENAKVTFQGSSLMEYEVADASVALGGASQVTLENASLKLLHPGGGALVFGNDFELRSGQLELEGASALNFSGNVSLGRTYLFGSGPAPILPVGIPVTFLAGSTVEIQALDDNIVIGHGATGTFGGSGGLGRSRSSGTIVNQGHLEIPAVGYLASVYSSELETQVNEARPKEIIGGGEIVNQVTGELVVDFGLVTGGHASTPGGVRAAGKITQTLYNWGDATIKGVAHPDALLAWWDGLIENFASLVFEPGWIDVNQLRQRDGTADLGSVGLRATGGVSVEGGTFSADGTFLQGNLSVTGTGQLHVGGNGLLVSGALTDAPTSTVHLQGRLAAGSAYVTNFTGTLILDGPGAWIFEANATFPSNVTGAPNIAASFGTNLSTSLNSVPAGALLEIRNNHNISGGTNWTTHGTFRVGSGSTFSRHGGSLGGNGEIRVLGGGNMALGGNGNWSGPAGGIFIESGGTLAFNSHDNNIHRLYDRTLVNDGTVNHNAAHIGLSAGTTITNRGTWNDASGSGFVTGDSQPVGGSFSNEGTFNKTGYNTVTFGSSSVGPTLSNSGTINVNDGTLLVASHVTFAGTSVVNLAPGTTLSIHGDSATSTLQSGARFQGAGGVGFGTGTHSLTGDIHASNASHWGGLITGTHTLHGTWAMGSGANLSSSGTTTIANDGVWNFNSHDNNIHRLYGRTLVNDGTVNHNAASIGLNSGTMITNRGTWNEASGMSFATADAQPVGGVFSNEGTFNKTGSNTVTFGSSAVGPTLSNSGTINVNAGTLLVASHVTLTGSSVVNLAAGTEFTIHGDGATSTLQSGARFQGAGTLGLGSGTHNLTGDIHATNVSYWGGALTGTHTLHGTWAMGYGANLSTSGTTTIASDGVWNFNSHDNNINRLYGRTFVNDGTVNHTAAHIGLSAGTTITNRGTWNEASGSGFITSDGQTVGGSFSNEGIFNKTGSNTVTFGTSGSGPNLTNSGTINVNAGTIGIEGNATFTATSVVNLAAGTGLSFHGSGTTTTLQSGARFQGAGGIGFGTGTHSLTGDIHASNASYWGGAITGTHTLHGTWAMGYGANFSTSGTTTIASDGVWNFNNHDNGINRLHGRTFVNYGTVNHNAAQIGFTAATTITNHGTWNESSGSSFMSSAHLAGGFVNEGTFIKTGANTVEINYSTGPTFSNLGTVDVQQGILQLYRNLAQNTGTTLTDGTWIVRNGATLHEWYTAGYAVNQADVTLYGTGFFGGIATLTTNQGTLRLLEGKAFSTAAAFTNSGTLIVGAGSSFTTTSTFANSGTLTLAGTFSSSALTNTGTLGGVGTITGSLISAGILAPGSSPGLLSVTGNLTLQSTSDLLMELGGLTEGVTYDAIDVGGTLTFGGDLVVSLINAFTPASGATFNLFDAATLTGSFATVSLPTLTAGLTWDTSGLYSAGILSVTGTAIPEPSTYAVLAGLAALGLAAWRRRGRSIAG